MLDLAGFARQPLLGILRGVREAEIEPLAEAVAQAGLRTIEITLNTPGASELIRRMIRCSKGRFSVGAGTVLDVSGLKSALKAGASFIVSPVLVKEVADYCRKGKIPAFPGALTPTEIYAAWRSGAAMVKVFPAKVFGPEYFREVRGPFNEIKLLACAGVAPENLKAYFENGASAVSFGASVFRESWLRAGDFASIRREIRRFVKGV